MYAPARGVFFVQAFLFASLLCSIVSVLSYDSFSYGLPYASSSSFPLHGFPSSTVSHGLIIALFSDLIDLIPGRCFLFCFLFLLPLPVFPGLVLRLTSSKFVSCLCFSMAIPGYCMTI